MKKYILGVFILLFFGGVSFSQGNDDCGMPTDIFQLDGTCNTYNNTGATFDIANGDCAIMPNLPNVWFTFQAAGPDLIIDIDGYGNKVTVAVVSFNPTPCDFASASQIACGTANVGEVININSLVAGETYYLVINYTDPIGNPIEGDFDICLDNPPLVPPPPNDLGCDAVNLTPNGTCVDGTTLDATQEFASVPNCSLVPEDGVFYEFTLSNGNLVATIDLNNISLGGDVIVVLGEWATDCNGNLSVLEVYCGPAGSSVIDFQGLIPGNTYVVFVATESNNSGDFQVCVTESGPPPGCSVNNFCSQAENIPGVTSANTTYTCVSGCNILASSEPALDGCNLATEEVVWYTVNTDASTTLLSATVESVDIDAPSIQFFTGNCNGLVATSNCNTGSGGTVELINEDVPSNSTVYIAVSNGFGAGGNFDLCVIALDDPSACTVETNLEVISTSLGSPLDGPFQPDETVSFCYTIESYTAVGNNCQWLQGIIPIFGKGWAASSFDGFGKPIVSSGPTAFNGVANWGWYTDVTYNTTIPNPSPSKTIFTNADGDLEMCHFSEPDCPNTGITAGDIVPPGWFAWTTDGQGATGHPNVDYGDGQGCGAGQGPWTVCFDLTTVSFTECDGDPLLLDTSIKIYTTADGETGSWNGGVSICAGDIPDRSETVINCCIGPVLDNLDDTVCPGGTTNITLTSDQTGNTTYTWTVNPNNNVSGYSDGSGQFITQTLENNTNSSQIVNYVVTPTSEEGCLGLPVTVPVTVLPGIEVDAGNEIDGCAQGLFTLGGSPTATGGDNNYSYNWGNSAVNNVSNPEVSPNISTIYTVTVTDGNGCTSTDDVELTINPRFEVEVTGDTILCPDFPETSLLGSPLGGTPNYSFAWDGPGIQNNNGQSTSFDGYGLNSNGQYIITLTVTDDNGCTGDKEFEVDIYNETSINFGTIPTDKFCPGGSITLFAVAIGEPNVNFDYTWTTPSGNIQNGDDIIADETGYYVLEVVDQVIQCNKIDSIFIEEIQPPEPEIISPAGVCAGDMVYIKTDLEYESVLWDNGMTTDSILVGPGTYNVTVTNEAGCEGTDNITVNPYQAVSASIGGSSTFCDGSSSVLSVGDNFADYEWTDGSGNVISTVDSVVVTDAGMYSVLVYDINGCTAEDAITVEIQDFLVPNIIGDTSICPLACTELDAGSGYSQYEWSTNETTQTITVCDPGDYFVTVYDAGGCTGEEVKTVTVNDLPTPQILGENNLSSFCPGDDLTLDAGSGYNNYQWEGGETNQNITVDSAGVYVVTVTDAEGCQASAEIEVTLNVPPSPGFSGNLQFCPGDSVEITPEAGYSLYEIDTDNNGSVDISNTVNESFFISAAGNSNIIVTDVNGCSGEVLVTTSLFTPPSPQTSVDTASYCTDGSVFIGLTQDYAMVDWYLEGNLIGSGQDIEVSQEGNYEVIVQDINGCSGITNMDVIESTELFPAITGVFAMCDSNAVDLNAGNGYDTYDWGTAGNTQVISVNEPGLYEVTVYDAGGCSGITSVMISNSATPSADVASELFICNNNNGENISLTSFENQVSGAQGFWEDTDGLGVDLSDPSNVEFDGVAPGFYTFTYTTSIAIEPCEDQSYTMTIEVSECLCPSLELSTVDPLCIESGSIDLDNYTVTNEPGFWTLEQGTGNVLDGSIFDPANAEEGTYMLNFNLDEPKENCDSTRMLEIEIIAPPNSGIPADPIVFCFEEDEQVDLGQLLSDEDLGGQWTETSVIGSTNGAFDSSLGTFDVQEQQTGTYTFSYSVSGQAPCMDSNSEVTVIIADLPEAVAGEDKMLNCDLPIVQVGTDESSGNNLIYKWSESKGIPIPNADSPIVDVEEEGEYYLEVEDVNSCIDRDTAIVTRNTDFPNINVEAMDPFCNGEASGNIVAEGMNGQGPYEFSIDNGTTWLEDNAFMNLGAGTYNVLVQDQNSCTGETVIDIIDPEPFTVSLGNNLVLQNVEDTLILLDLGNQISEFEAAIWTINDSIVCEGSNCLSYLVSLDSDKEVCVTAINSNGCVDSTCVNIRSIKINDAYTGNVLTPNDDGINDVFYIQGGKNLVSVDYLKIYNRWGEEIFSAENFPPNDKSYGWSGRYKETSINPGVYVYTAQLRFDDGEIKQLNGDITIMK